MTQGWRYLAQRVRGDGGPDEFLDLDLPLQNVSVTERLSGPMALTGTLPVEAARLKTPDGAPLLDPWGTTIWAEASGQIRGGGFLLPSSRFSGPEWSLECLGYAGYPIGLPYTESWFGVEVDPLDVVRKIWTHLQAQRHGDIGMRVSDLKTGLKIGVELEQHEYDTQSGPIAFESGPVKLNWYETHDLGDIIDNLAKETPFDYVERHRWEGDEIAHHLDFGYPRLGRRRKDLRFVIGENIQVIPEVSGLGDDYASETLVLGAGEGRTMVRASSFRPTGRVRRVAVVEDASAKSQKAAKAIADAELAWRQDLRDVTEVTIRDHRHGHPAAVNVGDEIFVEGRTGWVELGAWFRVLSKTYAPETDDSARLELLRSDKIAR